MHFIILLGNNNNIIINTIRGHNMSLDSGKEKVLYPKETLTIE